MRHAQSRRHVGEQRMVRHRRAIEHAGQFGFERLTGDTVGMQHGRMCGKA